MDLYAYGMIRGLGGLAEANGIRVPRLRGYRLMENEKAVSEEVLSRELESMVGTYWWMYDNSNPEWYDRSEKDYRAGYRPPSIPKGTRDYIWTSDDPGDTRVKRTIVTSHFQRIGMLRARFKRQYMLWNRYAGQKGVLYIHSRMGGGGVLFEDFEDGEEHVWPKGWDVRDQPWFLDVCADAFDTTYCDIYARVDLCPCGVFETVIADKVFIAHEDKKGNIGEPRELA